MSKQFITIRIHTDVKAEIDRQIRERQVELDKNITVSEFIRYLLK